MELTIILTAITGLILFLFGIENFSKDIQILAGDKLRKLLAKSTSNRVKSTIFGAITTAILQSSKATSILTISLVNAGIISFIQGLGVILGANIGTTITAQLIAFKLTAFAPIFIIIGFILTFFKGKYNIIGKGIFYFGIVFFSLNLISTAVSPLSTDPWVVNLFSKLDNVFLGILVGLLFTAAIQASTVTIGLIVILASSGFITLHQAIPLLLGANISTTIIGLIVSLKLSLHARRISIAHLLFNIIGALILIPLIGPFISLISSIGGTTAQQVANAHTIFNISAAIVFLIFLNYYKKLIEYLVPGKEKEILMKTTYLQEKLPKENKRVIELVEKELKHSIQVTSEMFKKATTLLSKPSKRQLDRLERYEQLNDLLDEEIERSLLELSKRPLTPKQYKKLIHLVRISNTVEQLGDMADSLGHLYKKMHDSGLSLTKNSQREIRDLTLSLKQITDSIKDKFPNSVTLQRIKNKAKQMRKTINSKYEVHFKELKDSKKYAGSIFVESISIIEQAFIKSEEIAELIEEYIKINKIQER